MRRLTTPTHRFRLSPKLDLNQIDKIKIVYVCNKTIVLYRREDTIRLENGMAIVKLSQEETNQFPDKGYVEMQIHAVTKSGDSLISNIIEDSLYRILDDEVL